MLKLRIRFLGRPTVADNLSCLVVLCCVGLLLHTFPAGAQEHGSSPAATEFSQWLAQHRDGSGNVIAADEQIARGLALARARAAEMRALLAVNPEAFVSRAMSGSERDRLPAHMQTLVERRVRGRGFFGVYCGGSGLLENAVANHSHEDHDLGYEVRLDGVSYQAFVYGKWRNQATVREAAIEGVVLDGAIAIGDSPPPDEQAGNGDPVIAETPALNGANTVLYIIAQFSDETNSPITDATALSRMTVVSNFFLNNSSGTVSLRGLVNPNQPMDIVRVVLPQPMSYGADLQQQLQSTAERRPECRLRQGLQLRQLQPGRDGDQQPGLRLCRAGLDRCAGVARDLRLYLAPDCRS